LSFLLSSRSLASLPPSLLPFLFSFFFFNSTSTTEIYPLSLHDALPICIRVRDTGIGIRPEFLPHVFEPFTQADSGTTRSYSGLRSEEHTSELQSLTNLVCRLLLEKKKNRLSHPKHELHD